MKITNPPVGYYPDDWLDGVECVFCGCTTVYAKHADEASSAMYQCSTCNMEYDEDSLVDYYDEVCYGEKDYCDCYSDCCHTCSDRDNLFS